jgi:hypothetical protein
MSTVNVAKHRFTSEDWVKHGEGKACYVSAEQAVYGKELDDRYTRLQKTSNWMGGEPRWDIAEGWYWMDLTMPSVYGPFKSKAECGPDGPCAA